MIAVYHHNRDVPGIDLEDIRDMYSANPRLAATIRRVKQAGGYVKVAEIDVPSAAQAFVMTQNMFASWSMEPNHCVNVVAPLHVYNGKTYGHRSSMVGDLFEKDGVFYYADGFDFVELTND